MTQKYYNVRREIYENCSDKSFRRLRTFKEMKKLFNKHKNRDTLSFCM